jgi:hypothetical protein
MLAEASRIRSSGALGRSSRTQALFDLLITASIEQRRLKEFDVACEVFDRDARFDPALDASVRVHIHRLRRKLELFYRDAEPGSARLDMPKGEYRIGIVHAGAPIVEEPAEVDEEIVDRPAVPDPAAAPAPAMADVRTKFGRWMAPAGWAIALALLLFIVLRPPPGGPERQRLADLSQTALWKGFAQAPTGRMVVIESTPLTTHPVPGEVAGSPAKATLPLAAAPALRDLLPVVHFLAQKRRYAMVVPTSRLQPEATRSESFIYVGFLAGLRRTFPSALGGSRYFVDELGSILDRRTGRWFRSTVATGTDKVHREYALLMAIDGPTGMRVMIVAGTGNAALNEAARTATDVAKMQQLSGQIGGATNLEALYEVRGDGDLGLGISLVSASARAANDWGRAGRSASAN